MRDSLVVLALVVGVLLAVPACAVGAPGDHTAPLDTGFEKVGEVTVNGTTYEVHRYDNVVPYASGYEFFTDGDRVGDPEEARRVARAYAWSRALEEEVGEEELREMRDVGRTAERAGTVISAPLGAIETALTAVDEAKQREALGVSVWEVAVSALPELENIETVLRVTRDELRRWDERVGSAGEDVNDVADAAESVREGGEAEYDELPALFENASDGLSEAEEISDAIASDLSVVSDTTGGIAEDLGDVRRVGDELASPFRSLSSSLGGSADSVEEFGESAAEVREVIEATRDRAASQESRLFTGWNRRRNAALLVYGTGVVLVILTALAGYGYRRRDRLREWYPPSSSSSPEESRPDE
mgnify:CR=1 FL=1